MEKEVLVKFKHVSKRFKKSQGLFRRTYLQAVKDVSFEIRRGEILAVVGESGCGKTTLARMLCKIHDVTDGYIWVEGEDISQIRDKKKLNAFRKKVQMIFQDPFGSLNPAHKAGYIIGRSVELKHPEYTKEEVEKRVCSLLETVGLTPASDFCGKHPNQLSGGQRQRIVIARALAMEPAIMVADEPTSMLDVSIGIDIMNLMLELKDKEKLTYLYITHNLASARYMADRMVVMYAGNCVEQGEIEELIEHPLHPYTILLLSSTPDPFRKEKPEIYAKEDLPDLTGRQECCPFLERCPVAEKRCRCSIPPVYQVGKRYVRCFLYEGTESLSNVMLDVSIYQEKIKNETY